MPNMNDILRQANVMQNKLAKLQQQMADNTVEASSGGGMVKVVATGEMQIKSIEISPDACDPEDVEMLQDMVLAAVNDALSSAQEAARTLMESNLRHIQKELDRREEARQAAPQKKPQTDFRV